MINLEHMYSQSHEYLNFRAPKLQQFVLHNFVANWQGCQYKLCPKNQASYILAFCVDFAENYSFMNENDIQTQQWYKFQITIVVHPTWRINADF